MEWPAKKLVAISVVMPLPQLIRKLYSKRFGKERPNAVRSIEEMLDAGPSMMR
jgi:hypothetical protein